MGPHSSYCHAFACIMKRNEWTVSDRGSALDAQHQNWLHYNNNVIIIIDHLKKNQYKLLWISLILRFSKLTTHLSNKSRQLFNCTLPVTPKRRGWRTSCKIALCHTVDARDARWPLLTSQWARPNYLLSSAIRRRWRISWNFQYFSDYFRPKFITEVICLY